MDERQSEKGEKEEEERKVMPEISMKIKRSIERMDKVVREARIKEDK